MATWTAPTSTAPPTARMGMETAGIVVGRATNAAWIEDRWAVGQLDEVLLVAVAAQNYAGLHVTQSLPNRGQTCSHELAF